MARSGAGRGTRMGKGVLSGTTVGVWPSGVTIAAGGLEYTAGSFLTSTELGYLDGATGYVVTNATAGYKVSGGSVQWSGASQLIATGLTSVISFNASLVLSSGVSSPSLEWARSLGVTGGVTAAFVESDPTIGARTLVGSGGSLTWMAFGT